MFGNDRRRIELAFSLLFSLPGTPVIYYGDELGMGDDLTLPERWPVRTCMQWTDDENAGFSTRPGNRLLHHVIREGQYAPANVNAIAQQRDPDSLFNWLRRLVEMRQSCPEIGWGECTVPESNCPAVLIQHFVWQGKFVLVLHNLSQTSCSTEIWDIPKGRKLTDIFGNRIYDPTLPPTPLLSSLMAMAIGGFASTEPVSSILGDYARSPMLRLAFFGRRAANEHWKRLNFVERSLAANLIDKPHGKRASIEALCGEHRLAPASVGGIKSAVTP
ncbi:MULTISPECIES: alpha-amylase family glycosyl hydrolase [unclassified Bradyrhizobium]|uniref:alpha-amylase family glycosyl hydrolase n=1 Tax=unclassified Bradyrhizobium TaxID=2631580 RepID=UPI001FFB3B3A|nr:MULTISPECIES: alpha-amylase family glycosyl hydrolase [unclassified Bradyrhizobium]